MITCHCNIITEQEIEQVILSMLEDDCWQLIVPLKVYHAMEKRGKCCHCFPNLVDIIIRTTEAYHAQFDRDEADLFMIREKLERMRVRYRSEFRTRRKPSARAA